MGGLNKREHLIATGQELIWSKGYDLCSIKDITTAAGLPKGSFYHYFETKEKFALEAMNAYIEANSEVVVKKPTGRKSLQELIKARIKGVLQVQCARECYMSVMAHAYSDQDEVFRIAIVEAIEESNTALKNIIATIEMDNGLPDGLTANEMIEFIDFSWRGARLKSRISQSSSPLKTFEKILFNYILKP